MTLRSRLYLAGLAALMVVAGCTAPATSTSKTGSGAVSGNTGDSAGPNIPDELKNDAFHYYGLSVVGPMTREVTSAGTQGIQTGTETYQFQQMKDGRAIFNVTRTGNLETLLGNMVVSLGKDGIRVVSSTIAKTGPDDIEMPADLTPGTVWTSSTISDEPGKELNVKSAYKVVGREKITTQLGEYPDAILITSTGEGTLLGDKVRMETKSWYVKDKGNVKAIVTSYNPTGTPTSITIEEAK